MHRDSGGDERRHESWTDFFSTEARDRRQLGGGSRDPHTH